MASRFGPVLIVVCTSLLAACSGSDRFAVSGGTPAASSSGAAPVAGPSAAPPPVSLAGRWTLSSTGTGSCAMTFGANPDATEGAIAPGGGCPFNFFTSRKWTYTEAGLTIRDHNAQTLAQLTPAGSNRFEGKTSSGQDVVLSR
ncbi:MAG: AprI/Inh family metalloprotease inhibitor [Bradyrhizobium sp.]